jgi:hypothetical protein
MFALRGILLAWVALLLATSAEGAARRTRTTVMYNTMTTHRAIEGHTRLVGATEDQMRPNPPGWQLVRSTDHYFAGTRGHVRSIDRETWVRLVARCSEEIGPTKVRKTGRTGLIHLATSPRGEIENRTTSSIARLRSIIGITAKADATSTDAH